MLRNGVKVEYKTPRISCGHQRSASSVMTSLYFWRYRYSKKGPTIDTWGCFGRQNIEAPSDLFKAQRAEAVPSHAAGPLSHAFQESALMWRLKARSTLDDLDNLADWRRGLQQNFP